MPPSPAPLEQLPRDAEYDRMVTELLNEYLALEIDYLLIFSLEDWQRAGFRHKRPWIAATNLSSHCEITLTLGGAKPCTLFYAVLNDPKPLYEKIVTTLLVPLLKKYSIKRYGFVLKKVTHAPQLDGTTENWQDTYVFADTRSKYWDLANGMFFTADGRRYTMTDISTALGMGVNGTPTYYSSYYAFADSTATQELAKKAGDEVARVLGSEYRAESDDAQEEYTKKHFEIPQSPRALLIDHRYPSTT
jgi:hypothetical protein